jgi:hypothetical protein
MAFSSNAKAADHLWSLVQSQNQTIEGSGFAVLGDDLRICYTLPSTINTDSCQVIWKPDGHSDLSPGVAAEAASMTSSAPDSTSTPVYVSFSTAVPAINASSPSATQSSDDTLPSVASVSNDSSVALAPLTVIATTAPTSAVSVVAPPSSQALVATGTLGPSSSSPVSSPTPSILKVGVIPSSLNPPKGKGLDESGQGVGDAIVNNLGNGEGDNLTLASFLFHLFNVYGSQSLRTTCSTIEASLRALRLIATCHSPLLVSRLSFGLYKRQFCILISGTTVTICPLL